MHNFLYCFTMDDVAMKDYSSETHFAKVIDFLNEWEIKGTFTVVPRSGGLELTEKTEYIKLLKRAMREGHEIAQHGLDHDRFEAGTPPQMVLDLPNEGDTREYLAKYPEKVKARHTVKALREMLSTGRKIIEDAIGFKCMGFRAPSVARCENLMLALAQEKYLYDSGISLQKAAWDLINNCYVTPHAITKTKYDYDIAELVKTGEYTWYLTKEKYNTAMEIAKHDFHQCLALDMPFITNSHVSPLLQNEDWSESEIGLQFYREFFTYCKKYCNLNKINFVSVTMLEVAVNQ